MSPIPMNAIEFFGDMIAVWVLYLLFFFQFCTHIKAGNDSPKHFLKLDWDKFDNLYDLHEDEQSFHLPPTKDQVEVKVKEEDPSPKVEGKSSTPRTKRPYTKRVASVQEYNRIRSKKAKEVVRKKVENMTREEQIAYNARKTYSRLERERKMKEKTGYRTPTQYKYHALKSLVENEQANPVQKQEFERLKGLSRQSSARATLKRKALQKP